MKLQYYYSQIIITLCLLLSNAHAFAEQWYHVELIVFEQLHTITDEQWPPMNTVNDSATSTGIADTNSETAPAAKTRTPLILETENKTLLNVAKRLNQSSHYQVRYHKAWQRPIPTKSRAQAVNIHSDDNVIEGTIDLYKATYLHVSLNLWLKQHTVQVNSWSDASTDGVDISSPVSNPNLNESRSIRSNKLYFFDHPKMGALLQLTPIETPVAVQVEEELLETFSLPAEAAPTVSE